MIYDTVIVGAGPAGSLLAKKLADAGLNVLIIEKKKLPRHKMCSGLISSFSRRILKREFGGIPEVLCCYPKIIKGIHVYPTKLTSPQKFREKSLNVWRSDFDYWLTTKASEAGAEVWDQMEFTGFIKKRDSFEITLKGFQGLQKVETQYLIGADGGTSLLRRLLYKQEKIQWLNVFQTYWRGKLDLAPEYFHTFLDSEFSEFFAWANMKMGHKGLYILFGTAATKGRQIPHYFSAFQEYLEEAHGFQGEKLLFKEACIGPSFYNPSFEYKFGKDKILLIGEAAGLYNIFAEGISPALTSAIAASEAILTTKTEVLQHYITNIQPLIHNLKVGWESIRKIFPHFLSIK
ncbi:MAG: FAD-dependent monooxygenase [Candidatus Helarchaeota archaeon]